MSGQGRRRFAFSLAVTAGFGALSYALALVSLNMAPGDPHLWMGGASFACGFIAVGGLVTALVGIADEL